jgi:hypothetical protein
MTAPTTALVPVSRTQKLALKDASLADVTEALLGYLPTAPAADDFPAVPKPLEANDSVREALARLSSNFNQVVVTERRTMDDEELAVLGDEYENLQVVAELLKTRAEQVKEYVRTHQDVAAEEAGQAFPKDIVRNGETIIKATPRDANGHYILAAPKAPEKTEVPGTNGKNFSSEYRNGRTTVDLSAITRAYERGEIDEKTYLACTRVQRVPDAEKIRAYALKTGDTSILARVVTKGRASCSMFFRGLSKK